MLRITHRLSNNDKSYSTIQSDSIKEICDFVDCRDCFDCSDYKSGQGDIDVQTSFDHVQHKLCQHLVAGPLTSAHSVAMTSWYLITLILSLLLQNASTLYNRISTWERRCFIEDVPDSTMIACKFVLQILIGLGNIITNIIGVLEEYTQFFL